MDPVLVGLVALLAAAAGWAGAEVCRMTHRQRGLDTDAWDVVIPATPADLVDV